jgi:hypothetical protein
MALTLNKNRATWLKKYLTASCDAEREFIKIHAVTSLTRIWQHLQNPERTVGIISGFVNVDELGGPLEPPYPIEKQLENLKALIADVKSLKFGYTVVEGAYMGQKERSLVVFGQKGEGEKLLNFLKKTSSGETDNLSKIPGFWQQAFIYKKENSENGILFEHSMDSKDAWTSVDIGKFSTLNVEDIYSKFLKKGQRWEKGFEKAKDSTKKFRFACAWVAATGITQYASQSILKTPKATLLAALRKCIRYHNES